MLSGSIVQWMFSFRWLDLIWMFRLKPINVSFSSWVQSNREIKLLPQGRPRGCMWFWRCLLYVTLRSCPNCTISDTQLPQSTMAINSCCIHVLHLFFHWIGTRPFKSCRYVYMLESDWSINVFIFFCFSSKPYNYLVTNIAGDGYVKGSIGGIASSSAAEKVWLVSQALGDIAFAYPYSLILIEIQVWHLRIGDHFNFFFSKSIFFFWR